MKYLVTVADDFGFSAGLNKGCIEAYEQGILREMSFMVDYPGSEDAVKQVLAKNISGVGIHLTLNNFLKTGVYLRTPDYRDLLEKESSKKLGKRIKEELQKFEDLFGRLPTHINAHHSLHQHEKIIDFVGEYVEKHKLYVRKATHFTDGKSIDADESSVNSKYKSFGAKLTDYIFEHIEGGYDDAKDGFVKDLQTVEENTVTEAFFHPAYIDEIVKKHTSLLEGRKRDLKLLKDNEFEKEILDLGFKIIGFSEA